MTKISIIIPIYNGEQYLESCIKSVLNQTLEDLEIICVDDGSTDGSAQVIAHLMSKESRIRLLHQKNRGAGAARNLAIENAEGRYVAFLDADDSYLDRNALEQMVALCEENHVPACASLRKLIKGEEVICDPLFQNVKKSMVLNYLDYQIDYNYQDFIFLRRHLTEYGLCFPDYRRFQDPPFLVKALFYAEKFIIADTYLYGYRVSDMSPKFNGKSVCDLLHGLIDNLVFAREHELDKLFQNTIQRLEFEYKHIFYKNISQSGLASLKLFMQANQIICDQKNEPDYMIKPLRGLLKNMYQYGKKILEKTESEDEIVLYGAGQFGQLFFQYLKKYNLSDRVFAFVVSDLNNNQNRIAGIPVITLQELKKEEKEIFMFVTVRENIQKEVKKYLEKNQYRNYELVDDDFFCRILEI